MPLYPVSMVTLRTRVAKFPYLGRREPQELTDALATARAELELYCPAAADGGLSDRLDRSAATIQSDLAVYYLRLETERDEDGSVPKALDTLRAEIIERMKMLGTQAEAMPPMTFTCEAYAPLAAPPFPDGRSRGSDLT